MVKKTIKQFLKLVTYLLLFCIVTLSVGTYFLLQKKEHITNIVVNQLNNHLSTPINTKGIDVSLFKKFPYLAIEFSDVWAPTPSFDLQNDTLFKLEKAYILLNVFKVLQGKYDINKLLLQNGTFNLYISPSGKANYQIWKANTSKAGKKYDVNLNDISLENIQLTYFNSPNRLNINTQVKNLKLSGGISQKETLLKIKSQLFIQYFYKGNIKYIRNGNTQFQAVLNKKDGVLHVQDGGLKINRQLIKMSGYINNQNGQIEMAFNGKNVFFDSNENIFNLSEKLTSYVRLTGNVNVLAAIKGNFRIKNKIAIQTKFSLNNAKLNFKKTKLKYNLQSFSGKFNSNPALKQEIFAVDNLYFTSNSDTVNGSFYITSFENPVLHFKSQASIAAVNINLFINSQKQVVFSQGRIVFNGEAAQVSLSSDEILNEFIDKSEVTDLQTQNLGIEFPKLAKSVTKVNARMSLNKKVTIKMLSGFSNELDFTLDGEISNLANLIGKKNTWIDLRLHSDHFDLLKFLDFPEGKNKANTWPQYLFFKCTSFVENLQIKDYTYKEVHSEIYYKPGLATLKLFNSNVFNGQLKGNCALALPAAGNMSLAILAETQQVDISQVFMAYNEFGQDFITSQNLKGKLNTAFRLNCTLLPDFTIDTKSILANADINITNGQLMEHKPMYSLSKYIRLDELKDIHFADLSNEIYIKDQQIYIPLMQIQSTAMDIEVSGTHSFDNTFEYYFNIYVSDLLAKKSKRTKTNEGSFTYIQRNNSKHFRIPLAMKGNSEDFNVELNKKQARENFSQSLQKQKLQIKAALHKEFQQHELEIEQLQQVEKPNEFQFQFEEKQPEPIPDEQIEKKEQKQSTNTGLKFEFEE